MKFSSFFIIAFFLFCIPNTLLAQVNGCTDPQANNYNNTATVNDGSCTYNQVKDTPVVKVDPLNNLLEETSGLQWALNYLWTFNDGGGAAALYKIDTLTNTLLQTINLEGATNVDWEDIAFDGTHFYIGDFGNNLNGARTDLTIYKFPALAIPDHAGNAVVTIASTIIERIQFTYSDQPQPPVAGAANATRYDCEAMIVENGKIHLFSKNWIDNNSTHYIINSILAGNYVATPLETLATGYLVTAADKAIGEEVVMLLGYQNTGTALHFMHRLYGYSSGFYFNGNKRKIDLPDVLTMGQAEGITFRNDTHGYISNEKFTRTIGSISITVPSRLRAFNSDKYTSNIVLPIALKHFSVLNQQGKHIIHWEISGEVKNVDLQHSTNGSSFKTLYFQQEPKGHYTFSPIQRENYYRLAWQNKDGTKKLSHIILKKNETNAPIKTIELKADGSLSFLQNNTLPTELSFRLLSAEGKLLAQLPASIYPPGKNSIQFRNSPFASGVVCMVATSRQETFSQLVVVQ